MSYLEPSTFSSQSTETIGQGAVHGESRRQRYASFYHVYQLVSNVARGYQPTYCADLHPR
jgi:hypothetical protein